ncbi:hypothetical protein OEZ85_008866 [Tetradesmus obliquus]|uniref:Uncharacterized protein n=1 Tax=Tetradesmus obliquus TaxID=3088 RepID=A0ABY8TKD5_TETOB|nr:hypothetical protein OEZ85_008866 [Tetradesmus obliquus]
MVLNPGAYCMLLGRNLDTGMPVAYEDEHWGRVLQQLDLSDGQVRHILACAELYLPALHTLHQEQRGLAQQLLHPAVTQQPADRSMLLPVLDASMPADVIVAALASNLKKQHVLRGMLCGLVCGELSVLQRAKAAVCSRPLFLDVHAMVCVLAQDRMAAALAAGRQPHMCFSTDGSTVWICSG